MLYSVFMLALRSIQRNVLRSFLTILGIVIGVSAVITMVTLGNGATQAIQMQITSLGSNLLLIMPGQRGPGGSGGGGGVATGGSGGGTALASLAALTLRSSSSAIWLRARLVILALCAMTISSFHSFCEMEPLAQTDFRRSSRACMGWKQSVGTLK